MMLMAAVVLQTPSANPSSVRYLFVDIVAVKAFMDTFEVWIGNMRVDLCGRDIAVTQHCLNRAQVGAIHEQVGGK